MTKIVALIPFNFLLLTMPGHTEKRFYVSTTKINVIYYQPSNLLAIHILFASNIAVLSSFAQTAKDEHPL